MGASPGLRARLGSAFDGWSRAGTDAAAGSTRTMGGTPAVEAARQAVATAG
ncbi:MAG: hypothetical protein ACTHU1_10510 [Arachnia sp.]